jgi:hypothetical protein
MLVAYSSGLGAGLKAGDMTAGGDASKRQGNQNARIGRDGYIAGNDLAIHYHYAGSGEQASLQGESGDIRKVAARAEFLASLNPTLRPSDDIYSNGLDSSQVDKFLSGVRVLAIRDMAELQAYLATTPIRFKKHRRKGYYEYDVEKFIGNLRKASKEYAASISQII